MEAIVAVDLDWGIGYENELLFRIRADLKRFKELTLGQVVILGRKTLMTFPGGRPLPGRVNLVMTRNLNLAIEGATVCHNRMEILSAIAEHPDKKIFVIGGSSIYAEFLSDCQRVYVTKVHRRLPADAHFPNLDTLQDWVLVESQPDQVENDLTFNYLVYAKKQA